VLGSPLLVQFSGMSSSFSGKRRISQTVNHPYQPFYFCYLLFRFIIFVFSLFYVLIDGQKRAHDRKEIKIMWQEQQMVPKTIKTHCHEDESARRHHSEKVDSSFDSRESVRTSGCGLRGISRFGSPCQNCPSHTQTGEWRLSQEYSKHFDQPFSLLRSRLPHVCRIMFTPVRLITDILKKLQTSHAVLWSTLQLLILLTRSMKYQSRNSFLLLPFMGSWKIQEPKTKYPIL
jgi:hypothetical protein